MAYQLITKHASPNYSPGRPAGPINGIIIHYWDDPAKKPTFEGVIAWFMNRASQVSAHYVVEAGRVARMVSPSDRAWHAGPNGNPRKIGIECNPRMSAGDLETTAELIANIWKESGYQPLTPHDLYSPTSCPGPYKAMLAWLEARAHQILKGTPVPEPTPRKDQTNMLMIHLPKGGKNGRTLYAVVGPKFWLEFVGDTAANGFAKQIGANSVEVAPDFWEHVKAAANGPTQ